MHVIMVELAECQDDLEEAVCGRHLSAYPPNADPKLLLPHWTDILYLDICAICTWGGFTP